MFPGDPGISRSHRVGGDGMSEHIHVIDVETTGLDPETDRIVEIAAVTVSLLPRPHVETLSLDSLVNPGVPIGPVAQSIHHIGDEMVAGAPRYEALIPRLGELARSGPFAAHRAPFDRAFTRSRRPWICTFRLARHLWPEAPSHANQVLRYYLGLEVEERMAGEAGIVPHRAAGDALVSAALLVKALRHAPEGADPSTWALDLSAQPALLPVATFGKHKGEHWADVPPDYIQYMAGQPLDDEDLVHTLRSALDGVFADRIDPGSRRG